MKKSLTLALCLVTLLTINAQKRNEIVVPDLDGYQTLKCDFHIHTVFSDGLVWPTVRLDEAYREGLDAIAITDHIEYRPYKKDIVADHNRSYDVSKKKAQELGLILIKGSEITRPMAPGHFNGIFLTDSNPLDTKDYKDAFKAAKSQNAFIFWNHPGWARQQPDTTLWWPEHTELYNNGCMQGIEVANGNLYIPEAVQWCLDKNLTMLGSTDIHQPIQASYDFAKGEHRTMTFVFAKERTQSGIREALENRRTMAWYQDKLIGREELMRPFFEKSIEIKVTSKNEKAINIAITNKTDIAFKLHKTAHNTSLVYFRDLILKPHTRHGIQIRLENGIKGGDMNFEVTNLITRPNHGLDYTIKL